MDAIVRLLTGKYAMMNLIPFNPVEGTGFDRPAAERAAALAASLNRRRILTRLRQSAGQDVEGACGQLRARLAGPAAPESGRRVPAVVERQ